MAQAMSDVFTEVVVAPDYDTAALALLAGKKNLRVLKVAGPHLGAHVESRSISGGLLVQGADGVNAEGEAKRW